MNEKTSLPPTFAEVDLNYYLTYVRDDSAAVLENVGYSTSKSSSPQKKTAMLFKSDVFGSDCEETGKLLMHELLNAIFLGKYKPGIIILTNSAVRLLNNARSAYLLAGLEKQGIKIIVCLTSAERYGIAGSVNVGTLSVMEEILKELMHANKVISI